MQLLNHRGIKVKKTSVQSFFTFAQEQCPWFPEESSPPGSPHPPAPHPGALPNKVSCFISTCVSSDNSFPSVRQEPSFGPWRGSPFLQLVGTLLRWDRHPDHSGYSGASLPADGPDPAAATGTLLSLVSSWRGQLAGAPDRWGTRDFTELSPLPSPFRLLSPSYPSVFLVPWSWTQKSEKPLKILLISTFFIN